MKTRMTFILLLISLVALSCHKDLLGLGDVRFCSAVENQDFDATGKYINNYLEGLHHGSSDAKLEKLKKWLELKCCVAHAEVSCNSCIDTYPNQSEINVEYIINGHHSTMTMDILMSNPLKFLRYH